MATDERTILDQSQALVCRHLEEIYRGHDAILEEVVSPEFYANRPPAPPGLAPGARYPTGFDAILRDGQPPGLIPKYLAMSQNALRSCPTSRLRCRLVFERRGRAD
jgi:hypothetical protein